MSRATLLLALALAGCAAGGGEGPTPRAAADAPDNPADVAARLIVATRGRAPGQPVDCVPLSDLGENRALSREIVLFEGGEGRLYATRVRRCPALRFGRALRLGPGGASLCSGEMTQVVRPGSPEPLGACAVGPFLPYVPQQ